VNPPPARLETERLLLRRWEPEDGTAFAALLEANREHYGAFIPFFLDGDPHERMHVNRAAFDAGESFSYGAWHGDRLIGGGGLYPRIGPDALEIGYHVDIGATRRGYATEIASALVDVGFDICRVHRLELHIHPRNEASIGVARNLGFEATGAYDGDEAIFSRVSSASDRSETSASASDSSSGG
jgi:RimJ/RimL family protein N-acetyltransferase